jgi:hypothetical protein
VSTRETVVGVAVAALLVFTPRATNATDRVAFTLSSTVMNIFGELHATVRVDPKEENRTLRVSLDGPLYFASTDVQLDGAAAARIHDMWWRFLPPGHYTVTATVESASGHTYVERKNLRVIGGPEITDIQQPEDSSRKKQASKNSWRGEPRGCTLRRTRGLT